MIILRQRAFSEDPEQKEFNSKAAKALNNKYLKQIAAKKNIPVYKSEGYRTVEVEPHIWKNDARFNSRRPEDNFNNYLNAKILPGNSSSNTIGFNKKKSRLRDLKNYDHNDLDWEGDPKSYLEVRKKYIARSKK